QKVLTAEATVNAGEWVAFVQQLRSDQEVAKASRTKADASYRNLMKLLPSLKPGSPLPPDANDEQRVAYRTFLNANARADHDQARVIVVVNDGIGLSYAKLLLNASHPTHGSFVQIAVDKALSSVGLDINWAQAPDAATAQRLLRDINRRKGFANATWN